MGESGCYSQKDPMCKGPEAEGVRGLSSSCRTIDAGTDAREQGYVSLAGMGHWSDPSVPQRPP